MGVINAEFSLDELRKFVPKFVSATTKEVGDELKRQASLFVRDSNDSGLLDTTPPRGLDSPSVGENAVQNDIYKVYVSKAALLKAVGAVADRGAKAALSRYFREGDLEGAKQFLNGTKSGSVQVKGYTTTRKGKTVNVRPYSMTREVSKLNIPRLGQIRDISPTVNEGYHKQRRTKAGQEAGRVRSPMWWQVVLNKASLGGRGKGYVATTQKRVGMLKAAWAKAARQAGLNVSIPQWIRRHMGNAAGTGRPSFGNPLNMSITLTNAFAVASGKINKGNINFLKNLRQKNIKAEMERRMRKVAKAA
jgi:hypothetical protein